MAAEDVMVFADLSEPLVAAVVSRLSDIDVEDYITSLEQQQNRHTVSTSPLDHTLIFCIKQS